MVVGRLARKAGRLLGAGGILAALVASSAGAAALSSDGARPARAASLAQPMTLGVTSRVHVVSSTSSANLEITKVADDDSVPDGSQIGYTVTLANTSNVDATGLEVTDLLPDGTGVDWTIDEGNSDAGWSVSGSPPDESLVYASTTLAANSSTEVHVVSNTTSASCGDYDNTASFTSTNAGSGSDSDSETVLCPHVTVTKVADGANMNYGSPVGYTVTLSNTGGAIAHGLAFTDALPSAAGIQWSLDQGNSGAGWSVNGSPPNQTLDYAPDTLAASVSTSAHVVSQTTEFTCGSTLHNVASFTTTDDGAGSRTTTRSSRRSRP